MGRLSAGQELDAHVCLLTHLISLVLAGTDVIFFLFICRPVQLEWFAGSAWNYALEAAKLLDYASAAALFAASADFHRSHPVQDSSCLNYQKVG